MNSSTRPMGGNAASSPPPSVTAGGFRSGSVSPQEFSPPLHMACERGLQSIVECLVEHHANVNAKVGVAGLDGTAGQ